MASSFKTFPSGFGIDKETELVSSLYRCSGDYPFPALYDNSDTGHYQLWYKIIPPTNAALDKFHICVGVPGLPLAGDANGDGAVDDYDQGIILDNYGTSYAGQEAGIRSDGRWYIAGTGPGDVNGDGVVDDYDQGIALDNYGLTQYRYPNIMMTAELWTIDATGQPKVWYAVSDTIIFESGRGYQQERYFTFPASTYVANPSYLHITFAPIQGIVETPLIGNTTMQVYIWDHYAKPGVIDSSSTNNTFKLIGYPFLLFYNALGWWDSTETTDFIFNEEGRMGAGVLEFEDGTMMGSPWVSHYNPTTYFDTFRPDLPNSVGCEITDTVLRGGWFMLPAEARLYGAEVKAIFPVLDTAQSTVTMDSMTAYLFHGDSIVREKTLYKNELTIDVNESSILTHWVRFNFDSPPLLAEGESYRLLFGATYTTNPVFDGQREILTGIPEYKKWSLIPYDGALRPSTFISTKATLFYPGSLEVIEWVDNLDVDCPINLVLQWEEGDASISNNSSFRRRSYGG